MEDHTKTCTKCTIEQSLDNFYKNKLYKNGFVTWCKNCVKEHNKQYYKENFEKINEQKKEYNKQHYKKNVEKVRERHKKYNQENAEKLNEYSKQHYKKNSKKIIENQKEYKREKRATDPDFKLVDNLRRRLSGALLGEVKSKRTMELLGCPIVWLHLHLESKFYDRSDGTKMTFDNYSFHGWHMDHIKPCASFDLSDPEQQKKCFHWTNLQPLWAEDNMAKSDKIL